MPPFRPLVRNFPRPTSATTSPYLATAFVGPQNSQIYNLATAKRSFSSSIIRSSGGETHYEPPTGWLFNVKPGEKAEKEGWETIWIWGFWGSLVVAAVAYAYKPDTSIQTWALEEARRRLEAEGILPDPETAGDPAKPN